MKYNEVYWNKVKKLNIVLSIMVVFIHAINLPTYKIETGWVFYIQNYVVYGIGKVAVPMFFVLSGMNTYHKLDKTKRLAEIGESIKKKIKARLSSLLIPYLIWVVITWFGTVLPMLIPRIKEYINGTSRISPNIRSFVITVLTGNDTQLWFLNRLILLTILMPLIFVLMKHRCVAIIVWCLLAGCNCLFSRNDTDFMRVCLDYLSGVLIAFHGTCARGKILFSDKNGVRQSIGFIVFAILAGIEVCICVYDCARYIEIWVLFLMMICLWNVFSNMPWRVKDRSFWIYLSHGFILIYLKKIAYILLPKTEVVALTTFFLLAILIIVMLVVVARVIEKQMPHVYEVLIGGRGKR